MTSEHVDLDAVKIEPQQSEDVTEPLFAETLGSTQNLLSSRDDNERGLVKKTVRTETSNRHPPQQRCDRIIQQNVNFSVGYHSVTDHLITYLCHVGHPDIKNVSRVDTQNVSYFLKKYGKSPHFKDNWIRSIHNKLCLNSLGWTALIEIATFTVTGEGKLKLFRKERNHIGG